MNSPMVSFLCPTFDRVSRQKYLLNEVVYWFTQQTYPNCELVILNDAPNQIIVCTTPGVRCVNWPARLPSLGDKMNLLVLLAEGEICCPWEDDDVSLPWRAAQARRYLDGGYEYWSPKAYWYQEDPKNLLLVQRNGVAHNCSAFLRESFLGRYESTSLGHDAKVDQWARTKLRCNLSVIEDDADVSYVYRWLVSHLHLSGKGDRANEAYASLRPGPGGRYELKPFMIRDYVAETRAKLGQPISTTLPATS